jgi:mRNA-degrading endonuclease toxin of MazEF toxin-antitoxin module
VQPYSAGQIVIVDWRDALPKEPNKLRPAIVVEDVDLFDDSYPNVIVVPLSERADFVIPRLSVRIEPTPENGCTSVCYAVSHNIGVTSKRRIRNVTNSHISAEQLTAIRRQCAESIGI